jgi:hypothetical protein
VDFGLTSIARDPNSVVNNLDGHCFTLRWAAPEMLRPDAFPASKQTDVFSFAMVMFEVGGKSVLGILVTSSVTSIVSGFLWGSSVPRLPVYGNSDDHYEWKASKATHSPQFDGPSVGAY